MNILLIDHYAGSISHGMEYRPYYFSREWIKLGHHVRIVASSESHVRTNHPIITGEITKEEIEDIQYYWIKTPSYSQNGLLRGINILVFVIKLIFYNREINKNFKPEIVIASSTYPLDIIPANLIALRCNAKLIYEVHDLWLLSPIELGGMSKYHPFILLMQWAENFAYKKSNNIISMLPKTMEHMQQHGMSPEKFVYIPNGIVLEEWQNHENILPYEHRQEIKNLKSRGNFLIGYAVSYYLLAKYILEQNIAVPKIKAVITTSEKLTDPMREVMEKAYGCKVYEEYSTVENALFASECEYGRLHVSPDVGIVEILRSYGSACEPGEVGEVVTTCLMRTYQPLIRFRLGDLAAWDPDPCPCGRQMPVIEELVGRIEDTVITKDGKETVRFHGIFVGLENVKEGQVIQEDYDRFSVKLVVKPEFCEADKQIIYDRFVQRLGKIQLEYEFVDQIERTEHGKFRAVISKVQRRPSQKRH